MGGDLRNARSEGFEGALGGPEEVACGAGGGVAAPYAHGVVPRLGDNIAAVGDNKLVRMKRYDGHGVRNGKLMERLDELRKLHAEC